MFFWSGTGEYTALRAKSYPYLTALALAPSAVGGVLRPPSHGGWLHSSNVCQSNFAGWCSTIDESRARPWNTCFLEVPSRPRAGFDAGSAPARRCRPKRLWPTASRREYDCKQPGSALLKSYEGDGNSQWAPHEALQYEVRVIKLQGCREHATAA